MTRTYSYRIVLLAAVMGVSAGCSTYTPAPTSEMVFLRNGVAPAPWAPYVMSVVNWAGDSIPNSPTGSTGMGGYLHASMITVDPSTIDAPNDAKRVTWKGPANYLIKMRRSNDFSAWITADGALVFDVIPHTAPKVTVQAMMTCKWPCGGSVNITNLLGEPLNKKRTIKIPLSCFAKAGARMDHIDIPWTIQADGRFSASFGNVRWVPGAGKDADVIGCVK